MRISDFHQRWLEFLNRYAVAAHVLVLPLSVLVLALFYALPSFGDVNLVGKNVLSEFMCYYFFWIWRLSVIETFISHLFLLICYGSLISIGTTYFLSFHMLLFAYRRGKKAALIALLACFFGYICFIYVQGWYTLGSYQSVRKYAGSSMPAAELFMRCGLPLNYEIRSNGEICCVYTNGVSEYLVSIDSPTIFATASVGNIPNLWRD